MKKLLIFFILFIAFDFECLARKKHIISPEPLIFNLPYQDILISDTINTLNDSLMVFNGIKKVGNCWAVTSHSGITILDKSLEKVIRSFRFNIKNGHGLFDGQDEIVGFQSIEIIPNKNQSKFLVLIGNGILFQIDTKTLSIEWLVKFVDRIETASYSESGNKIAIGTTFNNIQVENKFLEYSTLYLLESTSGKFLKYFPETASVLKVSFTQSDKSLFVVYDWPHPDSFLWDIEKTKFILKYNTGEVSNNALKINDTTFVICNSRQLLIMNTNSREFKEIYLGTNMVQVLFNNEVNKYVVLATSPGSKENKYRQNLFIYTYDVDFNSRTDKLLSISVQKEQFDFDKSIIYFASEFPRDNKTSGIYSYNMDTYEIKLMVDSKLLANMYNKN